MSAFPGIVEDALRVPQRSPRRTGSRSNRQRVFKAIEILRPVAASLGSRRPRGCHASPMEADTMLRDTETAIALLRSVKIVLDRAEK